MNAIARFPVYYGWVNMLVAAMAMVGTLPGRTQGLGLITEPLIAELQIPRVLFAQINLWATLIGALGAVGIGRLIDRFGSRVVLTAVGAALGAVVLAMSGVHGVVALAVLITLTRGLGQSALSVISLTIVGQWFVKRLGRAMAVYAVVMSVGFMIAFPLTGAVVLSSGWRAAWAGIGMALLVVLLPMSLLFVRRSPESCGLPADGVRDASASETITGSTLGEAMQTPAFWIFGLGSAVYGLIASGISLFNESIFAERGFDAATYHRSLAVTALTALVGNFLGGWLSTRWSMNRLMAATMTLLAGALAALPHLSTQLHVAIWAALMGMAGGSVMVVFFSYWGRAYGRAHLGKIQGAAQALTVVASAIGPLLLAESVARTGSYRIMFYGMAAVVAVLGLMAGRENAEFAERRRGIHEK
ncbi:MAG: MFS transporter [Acidobacteria bacterium]|nr:MFS transporter [Acidobacteriota bacterium]